MYTCIVGRYLCFQSLIVRWGALIWFRSTYIVRVSRHHAEDLFRGLVRGTLDFARCFERLVAGPYLILIRFYDAQWLWSLDWRVKAGTSFMAVMACQFWSPTERHCRFCSRFHTFWVLLSPQTVAHVRRGAHGEWKRRSCKGRLARLRHRGNEIMC